MLIKLQFDSPYYDLIDVPKPLIDWYKNNRIIFYHRFDDWLKNKGDKYYKNGFFCFHREAVLEWLNDDLLKSAEDKVTLIEVDKLDDPIDYALEIMNF